MKSAEEKIALLQGDLKSYGLTDISASDGPAGPVHVPLAASLPDGLAVASSFDPDVAAAQGRALGAQFRAAGIRQMLGPTVDIARTWHSGRVPEAFGEDPLLSGVMAAAVVQAVQEQGVAATLKHFAVYEQEQGRTGDLPFGLHPAVNNLVSERAVREIYLEPFREAITQGGALGVMCAFPRINGVYACENAFLLGILKNEWGFRGTVAPDFPDAQRSVIAAVNAGLDAGNFGRAPRPGPSGAPGADLGAALGLGAIPGGISLREAVASGKVSLERLNDMVRRKLVVMFAAEAADAHSDETKVTADELQKIALRVTEQGAVLLRNVNRALPLSKDTKTIAVFGAQAGPKPQASTSGSAYIEPTRVTPAIDALRSRAGQGMRITYVRGSLGLDALPLVPTAVLRTPQGGAGLRVEYFANPSLNFTGPAIAMAADTAVAIKGPAPVAHLPGNNGWSSRWSGTLTPRLSGIHHFTLSGAGTARLYLNDRLVAHFERVDFGTVAYASAALEKDQPVKLRVEFTPRAAAPLPGVPMMGTTMGTLLQLGWSEPDDRIARAVSAAKAADVAIVFAADRHGEGADRTELALPADQNELISAVAAANPHTIVVLSTAGPISMPWAKQVAAILETWYAGDAFGKASAALLFGDSTPGGRLPLTFPLSDTQGPVSTPRRYPGTVSADGALDAAHFDEDLLVGHRWFDATGSAPLFGFGQGLTYTPMRIDHIDVSRGSSQPHVRATVTNLGTRPEKEVVQVYLTFPATAHEPPQRLVAFKAVIVAGAQSRSVDMPLPTRAFEVWDARAHRWYTPTGKYEIRVGRSSREILFQQSLVRN
ncbi:MAG TPA: glycoside hydrolase family 3 C-terminal domain-containing protein [Steroidobacteraceae bacterium]